MESWIKPKYPKSAYLFFFWQPRQVMLNACQDKKLPLPFSYYTHCLCMFMQYEPLSIQNHPLYSYIMPMVIKYETHKKQKEPLNYFLQHTFAIFSENTKPLYWETELDKQDKLLVEGKTVEIKYSKKCLIEILLRVCSCVIRSLCGHLDRSIQTIFVNLCLH